MLALACTMPEARAQRATEPRESVGRSAIVHYEEHRQNNIVYIEESGGLMRRAATPVAMERAPAAPAKARDSEREAPAERIASTDAPRRAAKRNAAPSTAGARP